MLHGRVLDTSSNSPLEGVVVSNGAVCVPTDGNGTFELPVPEVPVARNGGVCDTFVMVSTPAGYRPETPTGWYRSVTPSNPDDFVFRLVPDSRRSGDEVAFAQLTDLHVGEYPGAWIADDIHSICDCAARDRIDCIVATGDLTQHGTPEQYAEYLDACKASTLPIIHVPGNHDWSHDKSGATWTRFMGPLYFSFNWGPAHFVAYDSTANRYTDTLPLDTWLAADLALVPPERPIVMLIHHQRTEDFYGRVRAMLSDRNAVGIIATLSGHWHSSRLYHDGHTLHINQPTTSMGGIDYSARGYAVVRVNRAGEVTLARTLLGTSPRARRTGIASVPEEPRRSVDPSAEPVKLEAAWPFFHGGPDRAGYIRTGPTPPFRRAWQTRLPGGLFFNSPVVSHRAVYVATTDEEHADGGSLVCLDAATGTIRWHAPTHGCVKHTPAVCGNVVIAVTVTGRVVAFDAETGNACWEYMLGDPSQRWIFSAPVVVGGRVYVGHAQHFVCLNAETGECIWLRDDLRRTDWISSYSSPVADETTVYVGFFWHAETLWALDRATGATRWVVEGKGNPHSAASSPVLEISSETGCASVIYLTRHDGIICAIDANDGSMRWTFDLRQNDDIRCGPRWSPGTPALADGMLYVPTGDGDVLVVDTNAAQEAWRWSSGNALAGVQAYTRDARSVLSSPVVSGNVVIVGASDGNIVALDRRTGAVCWSDSLDAPVISAPALSGNLLVCGASDGWLYGWTGTTESGASTDSTK